MKPLTAREGEIYQLVAKGMTNKQIGETLGISHKTVAIHMTRIFLKCEMERRIDIVLASQQKLTDAINQAQTLLNRQAS